MRTQSRLDPEPSNLVFVAHRDLPCISQGGPLRVIADLLEVFLGNKYFHSLSYFSVNKINKYIVPSDLDEYRRINATLVESENVKRSIANILNRFALLQYLQFSRDRRRLKLKYSILCTTTGIVHSHSSFASGLLFPTIKDKKILTIHSKGSSVKESYLSRYPHFQGRYISKYLNRLELYGIKHSDIVTFPSLAALKMFESDQPGVLSNKDVRIIYNGINIHNIINQRNANKIFEDSKPFRIITISSLSPEKRFDHVIDTVEELLKRDLNISMIHIGEGFLRNRYVEEVRRRGLWNKVQFLGRLPNDVTLDWLSKSDVFFLPSQKVVFDVVTLEAMVLGIPCVLSRDGGNLEIINDGKNGLLADVGDIKMYANHIQRLMTDVQLRKSISIHAIMTIRNNYDINSTSQGYYQLYIDK